MRRKAVNQRQWIHKTKHGIKPWHTIHVPLPLNHWNRLRHGTNKKSSVIRAQFLTRQKLSPEEPIHSTKRSLIYNLQIDYRKIVSVPQAKGTWVLSWLQNALNVPNLYCVHLTLSHWASDILLVLVLILSNALNMITWTWLQHKRNHVTQMMKPKRKISWSLTKFKYWGTLSCLPRLKIMMEVVSFFWKYIFTVPFFSSRCMMEFKNIERCQDCRCIWQHPGRCTQWVN